MLDEPDQALQGRLAVALLRPVLSCLDDQHPCRSHTPARKPDQPLLHLRLQGCRIRHIEAQLRCGCQLIDILSAWTARADENELNLLLIQVDRGGDFNHAASITARYIIHCVLLLLGLCPYLSSGFPGAVSEPVGQDQQLLNCALMNHRLPVVDTPNISR